MGGILRIILIGYVAGLIARFLVPGPNNPSGLILTVVLGIAGSFLATFLGQAIGWYRADQGAGFIAATVGAVPSSRLWASSWRRPKRNCSTTPPSVRSAAKR